MSAPPQPPPPLFSDRAHRWRSNHPLVPFRHACEGIAEALRTQRNLRIHALALALVLAAGLMARLPALEMALLLLAVALVVVAELFNTAVEAVVDLVTGEYHPLAKFAKDVAAGAVLMAAGAAALIGLLVFFGSGRLQNIGQRLYEPPLLAVFVAGGLLVATLAFVAGALGKGRGRSVSLPAALAFFLAAALIFAYSTLFALFVATSLALLVAQARVSARLDTLREVVLGAALALCLGTSVFGLAPWLLGRFVFTSGHGIPSSRPQQPRQSMWPDQQRPPINGAAAAPVRAAAAGIAAPLPDASVREKQFGTP